MPASSSPVDPQSLQALRDISPEDNTFLSEIITLFLEDSPLRMNEIASCLASGDAPTLTRAAHSLKGSSSNFGAQEFRALAEKIEQLGKRSALSEIPALMEALKTEYERVKTALEAEIKKPQP